ncbi:MAG: ATP-binding cassette domain-containing protein [Planctomycetes bacterium]|nr:ATP-binding cassette domain-containing protein [Planctomycetota bacterium]
MTLPVEVSDLRCRRGAFALGPLSFGISGGGRLAIVGPSGSGKTTLLRCLAGLDHITGGTIRVGDDQVAGDGHHAPPDRRDLGLVFQEGALWPHLTALQHLTFAAPTMSPDRARALLQRAGIGHLAERKPARMSGGEAQRLGLVRALAPEPSVLLLDEPLRSVDVHQRDALVLLVRTLADERGLTTILVTHDRDEALALATDLVVLHDGSIVEAGPARDLLAAPRCAFTAAFLAAAACLPTRADGDAIDTVFGRMPRPAGSGSELRLVLMPGDATAVSGNGQPAGDGHPTGQVLASLPGTDGCQNRIALGDQIVLAHSAAALPVGATATLSLRHPARLLPWQPEPPTEASR